MTLKRSPNLSEEKTIHSNTIFKGQVVKLRVDTIQTDSGKESIREIVEHSECVAIIAIDDDNNVLLVKQYRKPVEKELLEIPAGGIEQGEDPVTTVRRELSEETGYFPENVELLTGFYSTPGFCTEYLYLYLATELKPYQMFAEDTESICLIRIPLSKIPDLIASCDVCDAKSIAGLLFYLDSLKA